MVAGFACGGTSCVAGILHNAGVNMGESAQVDDAMYYDGWIAYPENPKGQYEDANSVIVSWNILGGQWYYPRVPDALPARHRRAMLAVMRKRCEASLWGIKAPSLAFTGPFFLEGMLACSEPKLIVVQRDEYVVAKHLAKRFHDFGVRPLGAQAHIGEASRALVRLAGVANTHNIPVIVMQYERLVANPKTMVPALLDAVFDGWPARTPKQVERAIDFVDPSLNHAETSINNVAVV